MPERCSGSGRGINRRRGLSASVWRGREVTKPKIMIKIKIRTRSGTGIRTMTMTMTSPQKNLLALEIELLYWRFSLLYNSQHNY